AVDAAAGTVACPAGITRHITPRRSVIFGAACRGCPLRQRCTTARDGRTVNFHEHDSLLRAARADWPGLREDYKAHPPNIAPPAARPAARPPRPRPASPPPPCSAPAPPPSTPPARGQAPPPSPSAPPSPAASPAATASGPWPPDQRHADRHPAARKTDPTAPA